MRFVAAGAGALAVSALVHATAPDERSVVDAARTGDVETARALLRQGADVNATQGDGMTALHWAAMRGYADLARVLLAAGANVHATTRLGAYTPLHLAAEAGHAPLVAALLTAGAHANLTTATGASTLFLAARSGSAEVVTRLIETGAEVDRAESVYGQTPLMLAAGLDRADVVRVLLARGAKPNLTSKVEDLRSLTSPSDDDGPRANAAPPAAERRPDVPGVTRPFRYNELIGAHGGLGAAHYAARQGSLAALRALVEGGADVNLSSPADETTPLLIAIINGHFAIATYLVENGADVRLATDGGVTPLYAALNVQWAPKAAYPQPRAHLQQPVTYLALMRRLLERGADPNARVSRKVWYSGYNFDQSSIDEIGATPFWRAAYASDVEAMRLLVSYGADPSIPTMKAANRRSPEDPPGSATDRSGMPALPPGAPHVTPLQAAAGVGYGFGFAGNSHHHAPAGMMTAVRYLVEELGADVNARDADGNTAVHHAASRGDNAMIRFLVARGADVTRVNRNGQTTVDLANGPVQRVQPFPETIKLLESLGAVNSHKCVSC
jgi:ankyrin repeat protein